MISCARPVIGIVLDEHFDFSSPGVGFSSRPFYALRMDYFNAIQLAGGIPIGVPYHADAIADFAAICKGWVLPGGDYRFEPSWYRKGPPASEPNFSLRRRFEFEIAKEILKSQTPVLGICNGMQVMAGLTGGKIDFGNPNEGGIAHKSACSALATHDIALKAGTKLHAIYRSDRLTTNSSHREFVISVGEGVSVSARSADNVIEAIEIDDHAFAIGVQWHPEINSDEADPLIEGLVRTASLSLG